MTTLTIQLSEEKIEQIREKATKLQVPPQKLIQASIDDLLARPDDALEEALTAVLDKNKTLYQRLASGE